MDIISVAGVDGCKKGWLMVKYATNSYTFCVYNNITELIKDNYDIERILIDIPLGLGSKKVKRTIEKKLRNELKIKHSSVFNPPCREALYESDYSSAKLINIEVEGRSLSIQSFNISNKIKELDELLTKKTNVEIIESHPELNFKYLNNGEVISSKKSEKDGIAERKKILFGYDNKLKELFEIIENNTLRKDVSRDDIADAICLCLVNKLGTNQKLNFFVDENKFDERGIEMKLAYFKNF